MTTTTIKGIKVLAVNDKKFGVRAKTFANNLQAETASLIAFANGFKSEVFSFPMSNVKYVKID